VGGIGGTCKGLLAGLQRQRCCSATRGLTCYFNVEFKGKVEKRLDTWKSQRTSFEMRLENRGVGH
jgi:hypothetical protein